MLGGIVRGRIATLRTPREDDLPLVNAWMADVRVRREGHLWGEPTTLATWKERLKAAAKDQQGALWAIEADGRACGLAFVAFERGTRRAWLPYLCVDPDRWARGIGGDAALALHRYLFDYLDLAGVTVEVAADNARGLRLAERIGYTEFGRGHEVYYRDGAYADQIHLRMDRGTWDERWGATEREYTPLPEETAD